MQFPAIARSSKLNIDIKMQSKLYSTLIVSKFSLREPLIEIKNQYLSQTGIILGRERTRISIWIKVNSIV